MVILNECRIDHEGKNLIVEATVENLSYYKNVYIESIIVDTNDTYSPNGPSEKPVFSKTFEPEYPKADTECSCNPLTVDEGCDICDIYTSKKEGTKHIRLSISAKDMNLSNLNDNIFFIYITATGIPAADTPCGMDNCFVIGVAYNLRPIYNMAIGFIKELDSNCSIPKGFIDMILRLKALELSLKTGNYPTAFNQWNKLFKNKVSVSTKKGCGCHGIN